MFAALRATFWTSHGRRQASSLLPRICLDFYRAEGPVELFHCASIAVKDRLFERLIRSLHLGAWLGSAYSRRGAKAAFSLLLPRLLEKRAITSLPRP